VTPSVVDVDSVLQWGLPRLRELPWRATRDPWAVLVSEVMLQQTQVSRVIPKWLAFLDAFPTPAACASAPLGDVLRQWQGLGYPRRARNLHAAATEVHRRGEFPSTLEALLELPGVGAYTARALMAFAFEVDAAVVDTNIARVFARVQGRGLRPSEVQRLADEALPLGQAWAWNQCLMDLGAVLCRPSSPGCEVCPLQEGCVWRGVGDDPAIGSAGVSRGQARFEGSDRQARGRLMRALTTGVVPLGEMPSVMQRGEADAQRLTDALLSEGLCVVVDGAVRLP
jgi:A/G-specific adenine glycosylase